MMLFLMASYAAMGLGAWFPPNGIATVLPNFRPLPGALPPPDLAGLQTLTGLVIHALVSGALGLVFGALAEAFLEPHIRSVPRMAVAGFAFAILVWMFFGFGGLYLAGLQPVFGTATFFFGHLVYGIVLGVSLALLTTKRDMLVVTFAPEEKPVATSSRRR